MENIRYVYRDKKELKFDKVEKRGKYLHPRSKADKNADKFVKIILGICQEVLPELPEGKRYYTPAISCNKKTNDYFHQHIDPMLWLQYSPREDDALEDFEFRIDMDNLLEETNDSINNSNNSYNF